MRQPLSAICVACCATILVTACGKGAMPAKVHSVAMSGAPISSGWAPAPLQSAPLPALSSNKVTTPSVPSDASREAGHSSTNTTPLTNAQIAGVTQAADAMEIDQAKMARAKTTRQEVKRYANLMYLHHKAAEASQAKLRIPIEIGPIATRLDIEAASTLAKLKNVSDRNFDRTFIEAQVKEHREVLAILNAELLPNARGPVLSNYLKRLKPDVETELRMAENEQHRLELTGVAHSATKKANN